MQLRGCVNIFILDGCTNDFQRKSSLKCIMKISFQQKLSIFKQNPIFKLNERRYAKKVPRVEHFILNHFLRRCFLQIHILKNWTNNRKKEFVVFSMIWKILKHRLFKIWICNKHHRKKWFKIKISSLGTFLHICAH